MKTKEEKCVRRALFKARFQKTIREASFYLMLGALALGSAPELIPHLDSLFSTFMSDNARKAVSEIMLMLSILSRFIPSQVREKALHDIGIEKPEEKEQ